MTIGRTFIRSLVDEVILKYENRYLTRYMDDEDKRYTHNLLLGVFAVMFFKQDEKRLHTHLVELLHFYEEMGVPYHEVKWTLAHFFRFYRAWIKKHGFVEMAYYEKIQKIYKEIINTFDYNPVASEVEEFMVMGEDGVVDKAIEKMHYSDEEKISAEAYFNEEPLDPDDIDELILVKDRLEDLLDRYDRFDDAFAEELVRTIAKLATTLEFVFTSDAFKDMGLALDNMVRILNEVRIEEEQRELAYTILAAFVEDLVKWIDTIFLEKSAKDIHYLDAALFANVSQFELMFGAGAQEGGEGEEALTEDDDGFIAF